MLDYKDYNVLHINAVHYTKLYTMLSYTTTTVLYSTRVQWRRGRASDSRLRGPWFESCAAVLKMWTSFFTLHCTSSLSYINEYLTVDISGYMYEQSSRINCSIWLDASQRN